MDTFYGNTLKQCIRDKAWFSRSYGTNSTPSRLISADETKYSG